MPWSELRDWSFHPDTGDLRHRSGRFFQIVGLDVRTNAGPVAEWSQPIIYQPEIGILGILAQKKDGILHFLMQWKWEPGNINGDQLSPTLQATHSNYTRVHGGKAVPYLQYFLKAKPRDAIADQLQCEQGGRFFRKRNRNIIVEVPPETQVEVLEGFQWMTLGQIKALLKERSAVNMDTRTVISCIHYEGAHNSGRDIDYYFANNPTSAFGRALIESAMNLGPSHQSLVEIRSWLTSLKMGTELEVGLIPLNNIRNWIRSDHDISHVTGRHFSVLGVQVDSVGREVTHWCQPVVRQAERGLIGFLVKRIEGVAHFLVQAKIEPGNFDIISLGPTVQCMVSSYADVGDSLKPPHIDHFVNAHVETIRFDTILSEEGGRFFQAENRYMIVEVGDAFPVEVGAHNIWMTLSQVLELIKYNYFNVEARSLIGCINFL